MCATFDLRYKGRPLDQWDNHAAFHNHMLPEVKHNYLYFEMEVCETFGLDPADYFARDREERKLLAGYVRGRNRWQAMFNEDTKPKSDKK